MHLSSAFRAAALAALSLLSESRAVGAQSAPAARDTTLFDRLEFVVEEKGDLAFAGREMATVTLRERGADAAGPRTASLAVRSQPDGPDVLSLDSISRRALARIEGVRGVSVRARRSIVLDGLHGLELLADASDARSGARLTLYHAAVPEMGRHIFFGGRVAAEREDRFLPQFRAVAESFRRTEVTRASLGGVRYEVASGYAAAPALSDDRVAVFRNERTNSGLFVAPLAASAKRGAVIDEVLRRVGLSAVPGEPQSFRWQAREGKPASASGTEVHTERRMGYNGSTIIMVQLRRIRHQGRDVLTGYYWRGAQGPEAARMLSMDVHMDSYPAGEASAWLIRSIVGAAPARTFEPPPMRGSPPNQPSRPR